MADAPRPSARLGSAKLGHETYQSTTTAAGPRAAAGRAPLHVCKWHTGCGQRFTSQRQLFKHLEAVHGLRRSQGRWPASASVPARDGKRAGSTTTTATTSFRESFIHRHNRHTASHFFGSRQSWESPIQRGSGTDTTRTGSRRSCATRGGVTPAQLKPPSRPPASPSPLSPLLPRPPLQLPLHKLTLVPHLHLPDLDAKMQQEQSQQQRQATMISLGELRAADSPHRSRSMSSTSDTASSPASATMTFVLEVGHPYAVSNMP